MVTREALKPAPQPRSVTILGSTGSVGRNTIDIISRDLAAYSVEALTAQENAALLIEQAKALRPRFVAIGNEAHFQTVKSALAGTFAFKPGGKFNPVISTCVSRLAGTLSGNTPVAMLSSPMLNR